MSLQSVTISSWRLECWTRFRIQTFTDCHIFHRKFIGVCLKCTCVTFFSTRWFSNYTKSEETLKKKSFVEAMFLHTYFIWRQIPVISLPQWWAAHAEIKVPSVDNTELQGSPFKAWSRSVYSHTCYAYCQGFLPSLFLPFRSIHLHFFKNLSWFFLCWLWLTHGSCVGPQNKIGHPDRGRFLCWVPTEYK